VRHHVILLLAFLIFGLCVTPLPTSAQSSNGSIGIFADPAGEDATLLLPQGIPATLYIVARLEGDTAMGMLGAEFRITGMPDSWAVSSTPNPLAAVTLGNPFQPVNNVWRANIAFGSCMGTEDSTVVLYTVNVFPTSEVSDHSLIVEAGMPPSNPNLDTPLLNICDAPYYTAVPVLGRTAVINPVTVLPDPAIASCDIRVSNSSPIAGEPIHLQALVRNQGEIEPSSVAVRFLLDGVPLGDDVDTGPIPVGSFVVASSTLPWNADFDVHEVTVIVDPDSMLVETSELNNNALARLPYDLQVKPVSGCVMFSTCYPTLGDSITVNAEIQNAGLFDVDSVDVQFRDETGLWSAQVMAENVLAGSSCSTGVNVSTRYFVTTTGVDSLTAIVDPNDALQEYDESNNSFTGTAYVPIPSGWSNYVIRSCDIVASDPEAAPGAQILLQAIVENVGGADGYGPTTVRFADSTGPLGPDVPLAVIPAGESVMVTFPWTVTLDPILLTVTVDPDQVIPEVNRFNNQAGAVLPYDFTLQTVYECPGACCPGDTIFVSALVSNAGLLSADSVRVSFSSTEPPGETVSLLVPHVPAKTYCALPVPTPFGLQHVVGQGNNMIVATVDPENEWPETNEGSDNEAVDSFSSDCGVDLIVTDVQYTLPSLDPGSVLQDLSVEVRTGGSDLTGVRCSIFIDGAPQCLEFLVYPTSTPGVLRGTCPATWVVPEPGGVDHQLLACVDPSDSFPELNEENNCLSEVIQATGPQTPVSLTDLEATSVDAGVELRWKVLDEFVQVAVDRRLDEGGSWQRLDALRSRQHSPGSEYAEYEYIDRGAEPDQSYVYRIAGIADDGNEIILGELSVRFSPPIASRLVVYAPSPNPFNPSTRIRFSIPQAQQVDVRILDSAGRLVKHLWRAELGSGRHDLIWHGTDDQGSLVPTGIYYCSVRTRSEQQNRKLVLIK
jgi:hypothetical protein